MGEEFHTTGLLGLENGTESPRHVKPAARNLPKRKVSAELSDWMESNATGRTEVKIQVARPPHPTIFQRVEREIIRGNVRTLKDRNDARLDALNKHQEVVKHTLIPITKKLESSGIVVSARENIFVLHADLTSEQISSLATDSDIVRLDLANLLTSVGEISGTEVVNGTQAFQYLDTSNYYNGDPFGVPLRIGIQEWSGIDDQHFAFRDWNSSSSSRILGLRECDGGTCWSVSSYGTIPTNHPTYVTAIALGDLMDGQDPSVTTFAERQRRSGYARESDFFYYRAIGSNDFDTAIDQAVTDDLAVWGTAGATAFWTDSNGVTQFVDPSCKGESGSSGDINSLYDSGTLPIVLAGNSGFASASDCRIWHPGSAIGAFVVGGHDGSWTAGENSVRYGAPASFTSRGGTATEGKNRTIVDISAPACRNMLPKKYSTYRTTRLCGTSLSAPTIVGLAASYLEYYKENLSNAIDDPGLLTANLLLFGDGSDSTSDGQFSNLQGAGRIKMRYPVSSGLDAPYGWGSYETCVSHHGVSYHNLNNGYKISGDVEPLKIRAFFYDKQHESGITMDDVDLALQRSVDKQTWVNFKADNRLDEKLRVNVEDVPGGYYWRIRLYGYRVTSDNTGCGSNSIRTYYTWLFEDSDRDDSDGPGTEIDTE